MLKADLNDLMWLRQPRDSLISGMLGLGSGVVKKN